MSHVITRACCNDAACVRVCPVNCIHPTPEEPDYLAAEQLYIDPQTCIDCGACVEVCPVDAISRDDELTREMRPFAQLNAMHFADRTYERTGFVDRSLARYQRPRGSLAVAIVGSGPAAWYAAEAVLRDDPNARVDVFERLPSPWGLVRLGVAPDHQDTKAVIRSFEHIAASDRLRLYLNVEVGRDVTHEDLTEHYHALVYAVGAPGDRRLEIPGEELPGSIAATDFVAWYNGHPEVAGREIDIRGPRAVVVGNGNVALDVARLLVLDRSALARTDIADDALAALSRASVEEVVVLGRRGPAQAAFTTKELLALTYLRGVDIAVEPPDVLADADTAPDGHAKVQLLAHIAANLRPRPAGRRRIVLRFLASPVEVLGQDRVTGLRVVRNELVPDEGGELLARPTGEEDELECGLLLRSVGYRGTRLRGLPFDDIRGIVPNVCGRVVDPGSLEPLDGVYVTGWIKRGPTGVIGTNRHDSEETVRSLLADARAGRLQAPADGRAFAQPPLRDQESVVDYDGWRQIDRLERERGRAKGRPRVKLTRRGEMLEAARSR